MSFNIGRLVGRREAIAGSASNRLSIRLLPRKGRTRQNQSGRLLAQALQCSLACHNKKNRPFCYCCCPFVRIHSLLLRSYLQPDSLVSLLWPVIRPLLLVGGLDIALGYWCLMTPIEQIEDCTFT